MPPRHRGWVRRRVRRRSCRCELSSRRPSPECTTRELKGPCSLLFAQALIDAVRSSRKRSSMQSALRASAHRCSPLFAAPGPCQDEAVIDHFGIICADYEKSKTFYDSVLGVLGYTRQMDVGLAVGYGRDGKPDFWLEDNNGRQVG